MIKKFKYALARNFLCFGEEGVEIDFQKLGNIVHIRGINQDTEGDKSASNGVGKSSIPEIPVYALFGKTIKRPKKLNQCDIVHNGNEGKDLYVEFQWDDYRIVRTRKAGEGGTGTLHLWKSEDGIWDKSTAITKGAGTQKYIIENVLKMTYETFVNVYIFGDDSTTSFLETGTTLKREMVENLLSLEKYRAYHEAANDFLKDAKKQAKDALKDYEFQLQEVESAKKRIAQIEQQETQWRVTKKKEHEELLEKISKVRGRLTDSGVGKALLEYQESQAKIAELNAKVPELQSTRSTIDTLVSGARPKIELASQKLADLNKQVSLLSNKLAAYDEQIEKDLAEINSVRTKTGQSCPFCKRDIDCTHSDSVIEGLLGKINRTRTERSVVETQYADLKNQHDIDTESCKKMQNSILEGDRKIQAIDGKIYQITVEVSRLSKIKEPQANVDELVLQKELETITNHAELKLHELNGPSPYLAISLEASKDLQQREALCQKKRDQVLARDRDLPYLDFWTKAFGDKGIRKYIIDGIIPTLNNRIAHWLQFLVDNKIKLTLNSELEETVDRYPFDGRPYVYDGLSNGQRRRLILSLAQSFAYILTLNCGSCPSALFLDEVTMNMDEPGVEGIYRMICELAKDRQVFVIDHNKNLLQKLAGCDTITLEMKNGVTRQLK